MPHELSFVSHLVNHLLHYVMNQPNNHKSPEAKRAASDILDVLGTSYTASSSSIFAASSFQGDTYLGCVGEDDTYHRLRKSLMSHRTSYMKFQTKQHMHMRGRTLEEPPPASWSNDAERKFANPSKLSTKFWAPNGRKGEPTPHASSEANCLAIHE
ncbi:hypothetical protein PIB30_112915 [Stylosanthes scabra]|uniref:Uncharacterized protein n=1 Tax=Stylosanthes scabra TaxID=79078 RepID=A0ABU6S0K3_9FABA|nr:hypothetical protein [Stylosanthes scabra]